jgi:hypothetical protein
MTCERTDWFARAASMAYIFPMRGRRHVCDGLSARKMLLPGYKTGIGRC